MKELINYIQRNYFLKNLFSEGLNSQLFLGKLELRIDDRVYLNIHTKQKPENEIQKWGVWGVNYNVIVIELLGQFLKDVEVKNWQNISTSECELVVGIEDEIISLQFKGEKWKIKLKLGSLIFQRCSTYLDSEE